MVDHNSEDDCWMFYKGKTLDVTQFLDKHPGGKEVLEPYYGGDISKAFDDQGHSEAAFKLLEGLVIGSDTPTAGMKVDPYRGIVYQIWQGMSLSDYLELINTPQFTAETVRMFDSTYLEVLSKTPWYLIPTIWLPMSMSLLLSSVSFDLYEGILAFASGLVWWTLMEYLLHRFLFHSEHLLPDRPTALVLHFMFHGIHHAFPMDPLRLVFPPALAGILYVVISGIIKALFLQHVSEGLIAGTILGYVCYDMFHYFSHHANWSNEYFAFMKKYHMTHHYKNGEAGFGVSSILWDIIFRTKIDLSLKTKSH